MQGDLTQRGHARTNYGPEEFIEAVQKARDAKDFEALGEIRETFRNLDSGRFYDFLDEAHNVLAKSDIKRRDHFTENYSDHLIKWIRAFGYVEDLDTFEDIEV